jgi:hypothetical protein
MAQDNSGRDQLRLSWDERRGEIDREITGALGNGRSSAEVFEQVQRTVRGWGAEGNLDEAQYGETFREYYDSRIADLERGGTLARQENGSFYVNPEHAPGEHANTGTAQNGYAEGATSSRTSSGSKDPADLM